MATRNDCYDRQATMQTICGLIAMKQNLNQITQLPDMPSYCTVLEWMKSDEELAKMYACAREIRAYARADYIDGICQKVVNGELDPNAARVVIDAEKWQAGKEKPRVFGDLQRVEHDISDNLAEQMRLARERRNLLMDKVIQGEIVE